MNRVCCDTLVDTGCSTSIAHVSICSNFEPTNVSLTTVSGEQLMCIGMGTVSVCLRSGVGAKFRALVVRDPPLGLSFILGMNGIAALGGVTVNPDKSVISGAERNACILAGKKPIEENVFEENDFTISYDPSLSKWTVAWNWSNDIEPSHLPSAVEQYRIPPEAEEEYKNEIKQWVANGWLIPHSVAEHGPAKGTVPLMAVIQHNKGKVRPVLDFRKLNNYLTPYTADADVCINKIREWRRQGQQLAIIDLCKAYLQIHVDRSLWRFQTVVFQGKRYCLTRLGFGISIAPMVMKRILSIVLQADPTIDSSTFPYLDDILVNESIASAESVAKHLSMYGLIAKPIERVSTGTRLLGINVWKEKSGLFWRRENEIPELADRLTRREVFSWCGKLTSHLPVCGWLRVATSYIKRRVNTITRSWDEEVDDVGISSMLNETLARVKSSDPAHGRWDVSGNSAVLWVDASSLATGALLEVNGEAIEDGSWLRKDECSHINLAELDAVLKGINLAVAWDMKKVQLMTDSRSVYHWVSDALSGKSRLKTKAASEMLIRRRLETILNIVKEYELNIRVHFTRSECNRADALTRVPKRWLEKNSNREVCGAIDVNIVPDSEIDRIHSVSGHPGIKRTLYFCRRVYPNVTRAHVREVVLKCAMCQSVDPAPERSERGSLSVDKCWERVSIDVSHINNQHYLTMIDCGPSRFVIWRQLRAQDTVAIVNRLEEIFYERGAPSEILLDNATNFRSRYFSEFVNRWAVKPIYRCANAPSGNGISERSHRSVKRIVARTGCSVREAVYRYNVTPLNGECTTAPANRIHRYEFRLMGLDRETCVDPTYHHHRFEIGDRVWIKHPSRKCNARSSLGTVTRSLSAQKIEVDGIPRHVRDLKLYREPISTSHNSQFFNDGDDDCTLAFQGQPATTENENDRGRTASTEIADRILPRRSSRERRAFVPFQYHDLP